MDHPYLSFLCILLCNSLIISFHLVSKKYYNNLLFVKGIIRLRLSNKRGLVPVDNQFVRNPRGEIAFSNDDVTATDVLQNLRNSVFKSKVTSVSLSANAHRQMITILPILSFDDIADLIWCLGSLQSQKNVKEKKIKSLNDVVTTSIFWFCSQANQSLLRKSKSISSISTAKFFIGISRMNIQWSHINSLRYSNYHNNINNNRNSNNNMTIGNDLIMILDSSIPNMNSQGVSNVIYSLGRMGVSVNDDIYNKIKGILFRQIQFVSESPSFTGHSISNILLGLSMMNCRWDR